MKKHTPLEMYLLVTEELLQLRRSEPPPDEETWAVRLNDLHSCVPDEDEPKLEAGVAALITKYRLIDTTKPISPEEEAHYRAYASGDDVTFKAEVVRHLFSTIDSFRSLCRLVGRLPGDEKCGHHHDYLGRTWVCQRGKDHSGTHCDTVHF